MGIVVILLKDNDGNGDEDNGDHQHNDVYDNHPTIIFMINDHDCNYYSSNYCNVNGEKNENNDNINSNAIHNDDNL